MKRNLDEINRDILEKIEGLDVGENIKDFLKDALYVEYTYRDEEFTLSDKRNSKYEPLINEYYKGD